MSLALFKRPAGSKQSADASCDCGSNVPASFQRAARPRRSLLSRVDWRGAVLPIVAIAIWWAISEAHVVKSGLLVREASGFVIGTLGGLLLVSALGFSRLATRMIGPSFDTFKQISLFAWIPLISVWFGLGDAAKVVFLSLAALLPVAAHTCEGIHAVPRAYIEVARAFRYSRWQLIRAVILPAALPSIFTGLYLALIYSWLATLGAEYLLVAGSGIGNTLIDGSEQFRMDLVLFGVIVVGVTGWALNALARAVERAIFARRSQAAAR